MNLTSLFCSCSVELSMTAGLPEATRLLMF